MTKDEYEALIVSSFDDTREQTAKAAMAKLFADRRRAVVYGLFNLQRIADGIDEMSIPSTE